MATVLGEGLEVFVTLYYEVYKRHALAAINADFKDCLVHRVIMSKIKSNELIIGKHAVKQENELNTSTLLDIVEEKLRGVAETDKGIDNFLIAEDETKRGKRRRLTIVAIQCKVNSTGDLSRFKNKWL